MDVAVYVRRGARAKAIVEIAQSLGLPHVLDLGGLRLDKSPYLHAVELDLELAAPPSALVMPPADDVYKPVLIADLLNVRRIFLPPPPTVDDLARVYDEAATYGVEVVWLYGRPPLARPEDVEAVAEAVHPRAARIVYDVVSARSSKEIVKTLVSLQGYMASMYLSNRKGRRGPRLPPFDVDGVINYSDVVQAALLLQWDGQYVLRMAPQFADKLSLQVAVLNEIAETFRSAGKASKKVQRMVAEVLDEIFASSGLE
ncbi:hypothetical protein TUZN_1245 [Thermoproteus uzoniensis 768-20]|uniref:Uncharacterized protein n=1 Tax=Thermoproteus uzoniensis (strain 768-20) TaxID=999630 RepID=F2L0Q7_THEU7|nr:hypothetical protein [Thermoproteus uzoniensis]AEA12722.1 hypothetical protein TUZN_1245 [Thermoproteus uzoniensis 768-20]